MPSMTSTTVGSAPTTTPPSRSKGDEITVIASSVSPSSKNEQRTESSFSKATGFSTHSEQKSSGDDIALDVHVNGIEMAIFSADHTHPYKQEQALKGFSPNMDTVTNTLGLERVGATPGTTAHVGLSQLTIASQSLQQATTSGQADSDTIANTAWTQRLANDLPVATSLNGKASELLGTKAESANISPLITLSSDAATPAVSQGHSQSQATPVRAVWANMHMDPSQGKWGEQMLHVLQDRVSLQATQNLQEARIRLDPPDLGKLDVMVRVDGDRLSVQINANHAAVRDALVQVSERLRAELQQQQFVHVDVNVGSEDQGQAPSSQHHEDDNYQPVVQHSNESSDYTTDTTSEHWLSTTA